MNINFELYKIFYEVSNCGNITKASQKLNLTQPAISKSIKNLEEQLGGTLFVRSKKGVVLTEEGEAFYRNIKTAMEYISNAENEFSNLVNLEEGTIKIGISTNLTETFFLPYLKEFHRNYPKIKIKIITDIGSELLSKLRNGLVDVVIMHFMDKDYGKELNITKIKEIESCFVASNNFSFDKEISIKDLNNYPLIMQIKGSSSRDIIEEYCEDNKIVLTPSIELSSYTLIVELVKIGLGIGICTKDYAKDDLKNKSIVEIKIKESIPSRYIGMAYSNTCIPSFSTRKLIEILKKS